MRFAVNSGLALFYLTAMLVLMPAMVSADEPVVCSNCSLSAESIVETDTGALLAENQTSIKDALASDNTTRSDVSVVIWGGWEGMAVRFWVEDQELETLYTAANVDGEQQVMWTVYPPSGDYYSVCVEPLFAEGLDSSQWNYRLVCLEGGSAAYSANGHDSAGCMIPSSSQTIFYFQLEPASADEEIVSVSTISMASGSAESPVAANVSTGAVAEVTAEVNTVADTQADLEELPHTGILDDFNAVSLLNRLIILAGCSCLALLGKEH